MIINTDIICAALTEQYKEATESALQFPDPEIRASLMLNIEALRDLDRAIIERVEMMAKQHLAVIAEGEQGR